MAALGVSGVALACPTVAGVRGKPYLHTTPGTHGYRLVFRLDQRIPRRADGSIDAGDKNGLGQFSDEIMEVDRKHACYVAGVRGRARHGGFAIHVRLLIGDGHDPMGVVHSARDIRVPVYAHTGHHAPTDHHPITSDERSALRRLGCSALRE